MRDRPEAGIGISLICVLVAYSASDGPTSGRRLASRPKDRRWPRVNCPSVRTAQRRVAAVDPKATFADRWTCRQEKEQRVVAVSNALSRERGGATSATLHWEIAMEEKATSNRREPWNKGKLVGQKVPFKSKEIWAIRVRLQMAESARELALFNLGIDSKLRACDLTALRVRDISHGDQVSSRAIVLQRKTQRPVLFEITAPAREAVQAWIQKAGLQSANFLSPSRRDPQGHIGTRQYARVVHSWVKD
jgi:integrase